MAKGIKTLDLNTPASPPSEASQASQAAQESAHKKGPKSHSKSAPKVIITEYRNETTKAVKAEPHSTAPSRISTVDGRPPLEIAHALFSMKNFHAERDLPIVYSSNYNIAAVGLELMHNFDTKKYGKIAEYLNSDFMNTPWARNRHYDEPVPKDNQEHHTQSRRLRFLAPNRPVTLNELEYHHTRDYLDDIHESKSSVARITETWALNLMPQFVIENRILTPIKWQVAGSIFACHLAMQHGWAVNIGGGFHQASADEGETFCVFSDVLLAMKWVWRRHPLQKFMIVDLDAHQATGIERDLLAMDEKHRKKVYMVDIYNTTIQPPNERATSAIDLKVELGRFTGDKTYLGYLEQTLASAFSKFKPTLLIYVAGQDVLRNDQLGLLNLSEEALLKRDELVFGWATQNVKCPIVMLLGGGYQAVGAKVQADSIRNLFSKGLIWGGHRSGSRSLSRPRQNLPPTKGTNSGSQGAKKA